MSELQTFLLLAGGLIALVVGGEFLVRGATGLAVAAKVSTLVIGLTVVAYGTSAPELVVSIHAAASGSPEIAMANVVGSNIFNLLFILGLCGIIAPLSISSQLVRIDVPVMVGASLLVWLFASYGRIAPWQALILLTILVGYTIFIVKHSRSETRKVQLEFDAALKADQDEVTGYPVWLNLLLIVTGLFVLIIGARWLVDGSVDLARRFGISETVIGLTIVAAGTSLPEAAASAIATLRGERDIAIGNLVGSSISNLLAILGVAPIASNGLIVSPQLLQVDIPVMVAAALACLPLFIVGLKFGRREALLFLLSYMCYALWLVLSAGDKALLASYERGLFLVAFPAAALSAFWIIIAKYRAGANESKSS
jgi:cation:H+ antiporter